MQNRFQLKFEEIPKTSEKREPSGTNAKSHYRGKPSKCRTDTEIYRRLFLQQIPLIGLQNNIPDTTRKKMTLDLNAIRQFLDRIFRFYLRVAKTGFWAKIVNLPIMKFQILSEPKFIYQRSLRLIITMIWQNLRTNGFVFREIRQFYRTVVNFGIYAKNRPFADYGIVNQFRIAVYLSGIIQNDHRINLAKFENNRIIIHRVTNDLQEYCH